MWIHLLSAVYTGNLFDCESIFTNERIRNIRSYAAHKTNVKAAGGGGRDARMNDRREISSGRTAACYLPTTGGGITPLRPASTIDYSSADRILGMKNGISEFIRVSTCGNDRLSKSSEWTKDFGCFAFG
ncbi:hypothetical protein JTB14_020433 [Gonioctena quinquepunctata]|nr:hypothetical protein JTB14_020433 [Gonioctena quinquepunctata]